MEIILDVNAPNDLIDIRYIYYDTCLYENVLNILKKGTNKCEYNNIYSIWKGIKEIIYVSSTNKWRTL